MISLRSHQYQFRFKLVASLLGDGSSVSAQMRSGSEGGSYGADALGEGRVVREGGVVEHDVAGGHVAAHVGQDVRRAVGGPRVGHRRGPIGSLLIVLLAKGLLHERLLHAHLHDVLAPVHRTVGTTPVPLVLGAQLLGLGLEVRMLVLMAGRLLLGFGHHLQGVSALYLHGGEGHVDAGTDEPRVLEEQLDDLGSRRSLGGRVGEACAQQQGPGDNNLSPT